MRLSDDELNMMIKEVSGNRSVGGVDFGTFMLIMENSAWYWVLYFCFEDSWWRKILIRWSIILLYCHDGDDSMLLS